MRISHMLMLIMTVLTAGGAGEGTLRSLGISRNRALFYLFCLAALDRLRPMPADGVEISPACLALAIGLTAAAVKCEGFKALFAVFTVALGICAAPLASFDTEWACYAAGALCMIPALMLTTRQALAVSCAVPILACCAAGLYTYAYGIFELELTEYCLSAQLAGIMLSSAVIEAKRLYRTPVRYSRTTDR